MTAQRFYCQELNLSPIESDSGALTLSNAVWYGQRVAMRHVPSHHAKRSSTILLVDDNRDGLLARRSVLEELGYSVTAAGCGSDALSRVEQHNFDLLITDYKMSPMNGTELITKLREQNFSGRIILLTGFAESLGLRPANTGADVVIQKNANEITTLVHQTKRLLQPPRKPARSQRKPPNLNSSAAGSS